MFLTRGRLVTREMDKATFAAGCFWHVEEAFAKVKGVVSTRAGFTGGTSADPSYEDICTGTTGHAESVEVEFDPAKVTYADLLEVFWRIHDPTTPNRQGPDIGSQYRSAIFYHTPQQRDLAVASMEQAQARLGRRRIVTQILEARAFYPAEEYHQRYLEKRGAASCRFC